MCVGSDAKRAKHVSRCGTKKAYARTDARTRRGILGNVRMQRRRHRRFEKKLVHVTREYARRANYLGWLSRARARAYTCRKKPWSYTALTCRRRLTLLLISGVVDTRSRLARVFSLRDHQTIHTRLLSLVCVYACVRVRLSLPLTCCSLSLSFSFFRARAQSSASRSWYRRN